MRIHTITLPLPLALEHINIYLIEGRQGVALVDTGLDFPASRQALDDQLDRHGVAVDRLTQIFITHYHIDHWGQAARLQQLGAHVIMPRLDIERIKSWIYGPSSELSTIHAYRRHGIAEQLLEQAAAAMESMRPTAPPFEPDSVVTGGETLELAGEPFEVVLTPGHSPAHACLHHPPSRTLLVGDHVLPHITPNITISPDALDDPLAAYRRSLKRIQGQGYGPALPGHGAPIQHLDRRIDEILQHHMDREDLLLSLLEESPRSCQELAEGLFQISALNAWESYMAIGETLAHLRALEVAGRLRSVERQGSIHFQRVACNG